MTRVMTIGLLFLALLGVTGQSTATAMAPASGASVTAHQSMQVSMAGMDCIGMATTSAPGKPPCKKITLQCMAAMGCAPFSLLVPAALPTVALVPDRNVATLSLAARLWGRAFGPEPDPPSFLI